MRLGFTSCLKVLVILMMARGAAAAPADDAVTRIDLSMRQATLVQAMTSAACFSMAGIDAAASDARALEHLDSYATVLTGLRDGHDWLGLNPETRPDMLKALARTQSVWNTYRPAVQQLVAGDYHTVVMGQILRKNALVVEASNSLAQDYMKQLNADALSAELSGSLFFAAQHRMMSQRVMLEACYVLIGIGGEEKAVNMQQTLDEIDAGFTALMSGNDTVVPPPNMRVESNLSTAMLYWGRVKPLLEKIAQRSVIEDEEVLQLLKFNESVLKQLNQAVEAYAAAAA
jgi:hypothetical protein